MNGQDRNRASFAADIERAFQAEGQVPTSCVIANDLSGNMESYCGNLDRSIPADKCGIVLTWEEARPLLSYGYDSGYGTPDCHAVYVYSKKHVSFVSCYDGSTTVCVIPRTPSKSFPRMFGG